MAILVLLSIHRGIAQHRHRQRQRQRQRQQRVRFHGSCRASFRLFDVSILDISHTRLLFVAANAHWQQRIYLYIRMHISTYIHTRAMICYSVSTYVAAINTHVLSPSPFSPYVGIIPTHSALHDFLDQLSPNITQKEAIDRCLFLILSHRSSVLLFRLLCDTFILFTEKFELFNNLFVN